jgi:antitoxin ParD1/3/4/toxin ParE1/3/4
MASLYDVSAEAQNDLFELWQRIAQDSVDLANRIENEFYDLFAALSRMPGQGHTRKDLTKQPVLFFPLYSFLVVYQPDVKPIRIMAVVRGKRNVKHLLKERSQS